MLELEPHVTAIIGAVTAAIGAGIVVWGATALGQRSSGGRAESLLAPTLAVDALDPDLRILYMRTLVVDARCQARFGDDGDDRWSRLTREFRRLLVIEQSRRVGGSAPRETEPLDEILDRALELLSQREETPEAWSKLIDEVNAAQDEP